MSRDVLRSVAVDAALVLCVVIAYLPALRAGFIWDDDANVPYNATLSGLRGLWQIWRHLGPSQQYYPLTHTSFWVQGQLWGLDPFPYHLANVLLHALSSVLLRRLLMQLRLPGATLAAVVFALHPIHVDSVAWITERKNVLALPFALGATLAFVAFDAAIDQARRRKLWACAFVMFAFALAAKTAVAPLPAVLLVLVYAWRGTVARKDVVAVSPLLALGAAAGGITSWLERTRVGATGGIYESDLAHRLAVGAKAFWFYPAKLLWPSQLSFIYERWDMPLHRLTTWLPLAAVICLFAVLVATRRRLGRLPLAAWGAYGLLIFPALGFFNIYFSRYAYVADHFQYFASIPLTALAAASVHRVWTLRRLPVVFARSGAALLALILCVLTSRHVGEYRDNETLFRVTTERNPSAALAWYHLGAILLDRGHVEEAIPMFRHVVEFSSEDDGTDFSKAVALSRSGQVVEEATYIVAAAGWRPRSPGAQVACADRLVAAGHDEKAIPLCRRALDLDPDSVPAKRLLAWIFATSPDDSVRNGSTAVQLATEACANTPVQELAPCLDVLAAAHAEAGDFESARRVGLEALTRAGNSDPMIEAYREHVAAFDRHQPVRRPSPRTRED
jgi:protein O-mannosyl-transferase